jgi:hypothetical protein
MLLLQHQPLVPVVLHGHPLTSRSDRQAQADNLVTSIGSRIHATSASPLKIGPQKRRLSPRPVQHALSWLDALGVAKTLHSGDAGHRHSAADRSSG